MAEEITGTPKTEGPINPEGSVSSTPLGDLLRTLGKVVDTEAEIDRVKGQTRDPADIIKEFFEDTEKKLAAAKVAKEQDGKKPFDVNDWQNRPVA